MCKALIAWLIITICFLAPRTVWATPISDGAWAQIANIGYRSAEQARNHIHDVDTNRVPSNHLHFWGQGVLERFHSRTLASDGEGFATGVDLKSLPNLAVGTGVVIDTSDLQTSHTLDTARIHTTGVFGYVAYGAVSGYYINAHVGYAYHSAQTQLSGVSDIKLTGNQEWLMVETGYQVNAQTFTVTPFGHVHLANLDINHITNNRTTSLVGCRVEREFEVDTLNPLGDALTVTGDMGWIHNFNKNPFIPSDLVHLGAEAFVKPSDKFGFFARGDVRGGDSFIDTVVSVGLLMTW